MVAELYSPVQWFPSPSVDRGQVERVQITMKFRFSRSGVEPASMVSLSQTFHPACLSWLHLPGLYLRGVVQVPFGRALPLETMLHVF